MKLTYKQWGQVIGLARADYEKKVIKYKKSVCYKERRMGRTPSS